MDPSLSHSGREGSELGVGLRLLSLLIPPSTPEVDLSVVSSLISFSLTAHHQIVTQGFVSYPCLVWLLEYCPRESRESVLALQNALMEVREVVGQLPGKEPTLEGNGTWISRKDASKVKLGSSWELFKKKR